MGDAREPEDTPFDPAPLVPEERRVPEKRWDPEERWSVGAAADRAGVTHNELIGWVQRGRLEVETVRRDGVEIRVVRAGDVAQIAPRSMQEPRRSQGSSGSERPVAQEPVVQEARPDHRIRPAAGPPAAPDGPDPAAEAAIAALRDEVARLRTELEHRPPPGARLRVPPALRRALVAAAVVGALVGVAAGLLIGDIDRPAERDRVGPGSVHAVSPLEVPISPGSIPGADGPPAPKREFERSGAPPTTSPDADAAHTDADPQPAEEAVPEPAVDAPTAASVQPPADRSSAGSGLNIAPPPWERDLDEPRWLASLLEDGAPLDAAQADGAGVPEPCAFRPLITDGDEAVLMTLGPCYGAQGIDGAGDAKPRGTHRVAGVHVCAHHAFVERVTRASRDATARAELAAEAEAALAQDLAPPLLRLRAERAAGAFLSDVVGSWAACGLDGRPPRGVDGAPPVHAWSVPRIEDGEGGARAVAMTLRSWVRVEEDGPLRAFVLDLVVGDGPRGDRMDALRWQRDGAAPSDAR